MSATTGVAARPPVSLVVPFLGSDAELDDLIARLAQLGARDSDELIVADNRVTDASVEASRAGVAIHPAGGVRSPGFARNRGAARAESEWLVFIDADTEPDPDLLDAYFTPLPDDQTAILAGRIVDLAAPDAAPGISGLAARHAAARGQMNDRMTLERAAFRYAQTANCAIRRSAFAQVGGFAEEVRAGEDADLCFRLLALGWELERRPSALVQHRSRSTPRALLTQLARHGAGAAWCNRRHPGSFPLPSPLSFAARLGRSASELGRAGARRDTQAAGVAALEIAEALAFETGRLLSNRARR